MGTEPRQGGLEMQGATRSGLRHGHGTVALFELRMARCPWAARRWPTQLGRSRSNRR